MNVRRATLAIAVMAVVVTAASAKDRKAPPSSTGEAPAVAEGLSDVLARFDRVQAQIHTLSAEFVQTTRNSLLKEPVVAKGEFFLTKPDSVLWEYSSPEPMRFVVSQGQYTGYFPERKRAEKRDIKRWSEQLFRFFGLGQGSKDLEKFYGLTLGSPGPDMKGTYLLVLSPKKRRVKKNVEEVKLWVDATTLLPQRIDYVGKDGNERQIRFVNTRLNPDLAAGMYSVQIPSDVHVSEGFSGFDVQTRSH
jgi:outer membrane lipoprotein-sorting protein